MYTRLRAKRISRALACATLIAFAMLLVSIARTAAPFAPQIAEAASQPSIAITRASSGTVAIKQGKTYKLGVKTTLGKLRYKTSANKIVAVSAKGVLKALKPGKATITVMAKNGAKTEAAKVKVTVVKAAKFKKVKKLKATPEKVEMKTGETIRFKIAFTPSNASNKNCVFSSSNPSVAEVSARGAVTAKAPGNAIVTIASCDSAKAKARVTVSVSAVPKEKDGDVDVVSSTLDEFSWSQLKAIAAEVSGCSDEASALAKAQERGLIGNDGKLAGTETKKLTLSDGSVCNVQLIGLWHDAKTGGGKAGLTFAFKEIIGKRKIYDEYASPVGWPGSSLRNYLNSDFLNSLPEELSSQIVAVDKKTNITGYASGSGDGAIVTTTSDKVWLLSMTELYGPIASSLGRIPDTPENFDAEGSQYKYYADNGMTLLKYSLGKKYPVGSTTADSWWLRSPLAKNANYFYYIDKTGNWVYYDAVSKNGVVPCFCL